MSHAMRRADQVSSGYKKYLLAFYYIATSKFSLTFAVFGLLLIAAGPVLEPFGNPDYHYGPHPVSSTAGILPVVGASFTIGGLAVYITLLLNRKVGELTE